MPQTGRKTFTGQIVPPPRYRSGGRKREPKALTDEKLAALNKAVVLAQPHRRGSTDDRRRWPVGRLILDGKVRWPMTGEPQFTATELEGAAERFAKVHSDMQWVMDSRRPFFASVGGGRREPTPDERAKIEREAGDVRRVLRDCPSGKRVTDAMNLAILDMIHNPDFDERCFGTWIPPSLGEGLAALVVHWRSAR